MLVNIFHLLYNSIVKNIIIMFRRVPISILSIVVENFFRYKISVINFIQ